MKQMNGFRLLVVPALILAFVGTLAFSVDSPVLDRIADRCVLKVGMSGDQAPMNTRTKTGQLIGLEVDLANTLAAAMGVKAELVVKPFPELLPALKAGEVDAVMSGLTITSERAASFSFVGPYQLSGKSILTKSMNLAQAEEVEDINEANLTMAALESSTSQSFVENYLSDVKLITAKDYDSAVKMVLDGRADAMVADMPACVLAVLRFPNEGLMTLNQPLTIEPFGIALPAEDLQFINLVENYFRTLNQMGVMIQLRKKWLDDGSWLASLP
jgi:polar amino acid transport system substrate-binding protein